MNILNMEYRDVAGKEINQISSWYDGYMHSCAIENLEK